MRYGLNGDAEGDDAPGSSRNVKRRMFSASLWSFISATALQLTTFVIFVILARLLSPLEFGLVAFAAIFIDITRGVMLGGIPETLIQAKVWRDEVADTAFWLNIVMGVVFCLLMAGIALTMHEFGSSTEFALVLMALSVTLLIDASRSVHETWLRREFNYKLLAARTVVATIVGGIVGVVAALAGLGVWALVINRVVTSAVQTIVIWTAAPCRPRFRFVAGEAKPLLVFSTQVLIGRLVGQVNGRLPDLALGTVAGPAAVGVYRVGSRTFNFLAQSLIKPLQMTTLSAFSRLKDGQAVGRAYSRYTQICATVMFPIFFGIGVIAPDFVRVCFGEKWVDSAPIMALLSLAVIPSVLGYFFSATMQAVGRPAAILPNEFMKLGIGVAILPVTATVGVVTAAAGEMARLYAMLPQTLLILRREVGLSPAKLLKGIAVPLGCTFAMCALVLALQWTVFASMTPLLRLICVVPIAALFYGLAMLLVGRAFLIGVIASMRDGLPPSIRARLDPLIAGR